MAGIRRRYAQFKSRFCVWHRYH